MRDYVSKLVIPVVALAVSGASTLLITYVCYDYVATGEVSLKWFDFAEPEVVEITVSNLFLVGALGGLIIGGMGRLLGIQLANRVGAAVVLGIAGAVIVALLFSYFVAASAHYHGPVSPGG